MISRRAIARNVLFTWASRAVEAFVGFVIAPFLVNHLGDSLYGTWAVIGALTGYFGLLDLGVRTSVGRYLAFHRAKGDYESVNTTFSTAAVLLCGVGALALLGTLGLELLFFDLLPDVPAAHVSEARIALLIVGLNLALTLPLSLFDATLWAFQRFDLLSILDISAAVLRTVLTLSIIRGTNDLITLAVLTLCATVLCEFGKGVCSFWVERRLRFRWAFVRFRAVGSLYSYGIWRILMAVGSLSATRLNPVLIAAWLGVALVTPYSLATRLIGYLATVLMAMRAVLTPVAATLSAEDDNESQQRLMTAGSRYCATVTLLFLVGFLLLGHPFLDLWIGPHMGEAATLLGVLALGEFLPLSLSAATSTLLGMGRHRVLALLAVVEAVAALGLGLVAVQAYGLLGLCVVQAAVSTLCRGVLPLIYVCRVLRIPVGQYLVASFVPPLMAALAPCFLLALMLGWHRPETWLEFALYGLTLAGCFALAALPLLHFEGVKARLQALLKQG
jgi:O-antigen/teichoic acid export membrane protein